MALIGVLYLPTGFLVEQFPVPTYYVTCTADCPANALTLLSSTPGWITDGVIPVREAITVLITALIVWRLAYRLQHATRLMRRALCPSSLRDRPHRLARHLDRPAPSRGDR